MPVFLGIIGKAHGQPFNHRVAEKQYTFATGIRHITANYRINRQTHIGGIFMLFYISHFPHLICNR